MFGLREEVKGLNFYDLVTGFVELREVAYLRGRVAGYMGGQHHEHRFPVSYL